MIGPCKTVCCHQNEAVFTVFRLWRLSEKRSGIWNKGVYLLLVLLSSRCFSYFPKSSWIIKVKWSKSHRRHIEWYWQHYWAPIWMNFPWNQPFSVWQPVAPLAGLTLMIKSTQTKLAILLKDVMFFYLWHRVVDKSSFPRLLNSSPFISWTP